MPRKRSEVLRDATFADIKASARRLMAERGTAGLSMRAIARDLGITAPALYYYYPSLDSLITALILDSFNDLADASAAARDAQLSGSALDRVIAAAEAYRQWALEHPVDFILINGSPIPGYHAPADLTGPAAARALEVNIEVMADALASGELPMTSEVAQMPDSLRQTLAQLRAERHYEWPVEAIYLALVGWIQAYGLIALEVYNDLQPLIGEQSGTLFRHRLRHGLGLPDR